MDRPASSVMLAALCSVQTVPLARADVVSPQDVDERAEALFAANRPLEAAQLYAQALNDLPERPDTRDRRNSWAIGAVNAYTAAFELDRAQCATSHAGLVLADEYLADLVWGYGEEARDSAEYGGMRGLRDGLEQMRAQHGCLEMAPRKLAGLPVADPLFHRPPNVAEACGRDIVFRARARGVPEGGKVAFYWRSAEGGEFRAEVMNLFGHFASVRLAANDHRDEPVEYFIHVVDAADRRLENQGDADSPLKLDIVCVEEEPMPGPPPKPKHLLPRVFINIGLGAGLGLARGVADLSYQQYSPFGQSLVYGPAEYACSLARWQVGPSGVAGDATSFAASLADVPYGAPYSIAELAQVYDADKCAAHHPVKSGLAPAPFHIAPEIGVRIGRALVIAGFARLQVVTGSKVFRDDPKLNLHDSFKEDVLNSNPQGIRVKPGFTGAGGIKVKYFLGQQEQKFRLFVGGMIGGGFARLRVPMGFANDRNGNSVPDNLEAASVNTPGGCQPVWPYSGGCAGGATGGAAQALARSVATQADKSARIDTVRIGGGFIGATFGFNYQLVKNFAMFAEVQLSVWFPRTSTFLLDLNVGPIITF